MNALASLIVTSYNHARYLDQRMETLLAQTYEPKEIIVVDDHSTDDTPRVLEKYRGRAGVRIVVNEKNGGGYVQAANQGVSLAKGELVMIAQSDDFNAPTHVARLAAGFKGGVGAAFSRSALVDDQGFVRGEDFAFREKEFQKRGAVDAVLPGALLRRFLLISCVIPNLSAALVRRDLYLKLGGLSTRFGSGSDWDFWCRAALETDFFYAAESLNFFRTHPLTVRSTYPPQRGLEEITELLFAARRRESLGWREDARFKLNLGVLWADSFLRRPFYWLTHLLGAAKLLTGHDRTMVFYALAGLPIKLKRSLARRIWRLA